MSTLKRKDDFAMRCRVFGLDDDWSPAERRTFDFTRLREVGPLLDAAEKALETLSDELQFAFWFKLALYGQLTRELDAEVAALAEDARTVVSEAITYARGGQPQRTARPVSHALSEQDRALVRDLVARARLAAAGGIEQIERRELEIAVQANPDVRRGRPPRHSALTEREQDVAELLIQGLSNEAIARRLSLHVETVKKHVASFARTLKARNRTHAAALYVASRQTGGCGPAGLAARADEGTSSHDGNGARRSIPRPDRFRQAIGGESSG